MYQLAFENRFLKVEYDASRYCLRTTFTGFFSTEEYLKANDDIVAYALQNRVLAIVSDVKHSGMVKKEDQATVVANHVPKLIAAGLKMTAFIMPESVFTTISLKNFKGVIDTSGPILSGTFSEVSQAENWVTEQLQAIPVGR